METTPRPRRRQSGAGRRYHATTPPDEAALAAHETEVARLEERKEQLQPLLKLIERREELLLERTALSALQKDPGRLLRRGPGAAAERKYENEAMRRVKQLPKLTEKLFEKLVEWEATESPVLRDGLRRARRADRLRRGSRRRHVRGGSRPRTRRGDAATATWIIRG